MEKLNTSAIAKGFNLSRKVCRAAYEGPTIFPEIFQPWLVAMLSNTPLITLIGFGIYRFIPA